MSEESWNSSAGVSKPGASPSSSGDEGSTSSARNSFKSPSLDLGRLVWRTIIACRPTLPCHVSPVLSGSGGASGSGEGSPSPARSMIVLLALRIAEADEDLRVSSAAGGSRLKYSSSATSFSSVSLDVAAKCCPKDDWLCRRGRPICPEPRFTGFPESHEPSESTEANDWDGTGGGTSDEGKSIDRCWLNCSSCLL